MTTDTIPGAVEPPEPWPEPGLATEDCYKCSGEGGALEAEGPYTVFAPCYRCGNTGKLPAGTLAEIERTRCPGGCGPDGKVYVKHPEDAGCDGWYSCQECGGLGIKIEPEPPMLPCGHRTHEEGGPSDYGPKCRFGGAP